MEAEADLDDDEDELAELDDEEDKIKLPKISKDKELHMGTKIPIKKSGAKCPKGQH